MLTSILDVPPAPLGVAQSRSARRQRRHSAVGDQPPVCRREKSGEDSKLIEVAGAEHFEPIDPRSSAWPVVKEAVLELVEGGLNDNDSSE
jgi:hypothetical protein